MTPNFTHSKVLGKYTPTPPVQSEELKCAYARIATLEADLLECREYLEDHVDVVDGSDGPMPNRAMALVSMIDCSILGEGNF